MQPHTHIVPMVFGFDASVVRVFEQDGEIWFVATDICTVLGYKNIIKAIANHLDEDEQSIFSLRSEKKPTLVISESGLYELIICSQKPEARNFAKWVTSEVLPSIRKKDHDSKFHKKIDVNALKILLSNIRSACFALNEAELQVLLLEQE